MIVPACGVGAAWPVGACRAVFDVTSGESAW